MTTRQRRGSRTAAAAALVFIGLACAGGGPAPSTAAPLEGVIVAGGVAVTALPPGWTLTGDRQLQHPSGFRAALLPAVPIEGSAERTFAALLTQVGPDVPADDWKPTRGRTRTGAVVHYASAYTERQGVKVYALPIAFEVGNTLTVLAALYPGGYPKQRLDHVGELVAAVVTSDATSAFDGGLEGFYVGFGSVTAVTAAGTVGATAGTRAYWFDADGRIVISSRGMVDPDAHCARYPKHCGRYRVRGNQLHTVVAGSTFAQRIGIGRLREQALARRSDGDLELDGLRLRATPPEHGLELDGHYRTSSAGTTADGRFSAYAATDYVFTPDGRYAKGGQAATLSNQAVSSTTRAKGRGTYQVDGYELVLRDASGEQRLPFFRHDTLLVIDGDLYHRR